MATTYSDEMVGGHPALDFINSVHDWTVESPRDYLTDFDEAIRFGIATGILSPREKSKLSQRSADDELSRVRELRDSLARILRALIRGANPSTADLNRLSAIGVEVAKVSRFHSGAGMALRRDVAAPSSGAATLRLRLADVAISLLTSPVVERIKECPNCGWFFLDQSKNRSRRWCSMNMCGASAKSKAYYRRQNPR